MRRLKSTLALLLVFAMTFSFQSAVFAAAKDTGFSDVNADAWYADAVEYCVESGLMSGTGSGIFSPDAPMSRAMLATVLYRMDGSPENTGTNGFSDVAQHIWYTSAVIWAAQNEIMSGYGSGLFGTNDPVTREQIATILWRYSGSPIASNEASSFSDSANISSYAVEAVAWARGIGVINGKPGNLFDPKGNATRAEVATILQNYSSIEQPNPTPQLTPEPQPTPTPTPEPNIKNISITVGSSVFSVTLYDNDTARALLALLPMTISMSELNGNEKYNYLSANLPTDSQQVGYINSGDLMLYGSNCLVLFYESFSTTYGYTKLGYIEDASGLAAALGSGNAEVSFNVSE